MMLSLVVVAAEVDTAAGVAVMAAEEAMVAEEVLVVASAVDTAAASAVDTVVSPVDTVVLATADFVAGGFRVVGSEVVQSTLSEAGVASAQPR